MKNNNVTRKLQERFGDPIGSYAGDAPVGVRSVQEINEGEICDCCGMMSVDNECGCSDDGVMTIDKSGMMSSVYEAVEPCAECGMLEVEETCGCTHNESALEEVTPPGKEKMVKALKKEPEVDNPWAVAWYMHGKEKSKK